MMAALDRRCGVDPGVCVWRGESMDSLDSFDKDMQQWEEQLQEVQRKIEELFKVVEARKGTNPNSSAHLDFTLLPISNANSYPNNSDRTGNINPVPLQQKTFKHPCDNTSNGVNYQNSSFEGPQNRTVKGQDVMMDILDGYLGVESRSLSQIPEKPRGTLNASFIQNQTGYIYQNGSIKEPVTGRTGCVSLGQFEEQENQKNKGSTWYEPQVQHVSWKDQVTSIEKSVNKPPIMQKDSPHLLARSTHFSDTTKCPIMDRTCGSPSVLRRFCAMLQENEGKTLIEDGMVTMLMPKLVAKSPKLSGNRRSQPVSVKNSDVSATFQNKEQRAAKFSTKTSQCGTENLQTECKTTEMILGNCPTSSPRNTPSPLQVSCESSPTTPRRSFSRPARPAKQRPPSRWTSQSPTATTTTPTIYRARSLSPACRTKKNVNNYSLYTETVIM